MLSARDDGCPPLESYVDPNREEMQMEIGSEERAIQELIKQSSKDKTRGVK